MTLTWSSIAKSRFILASGAYLSPVKSTLLVVNCNRSARYNPIKTTQSAARFTTTEATICNVYPNQSGRLGVFRIGLDWIVDGATAKGWTYGALTCRAIRLTTARLYKPPNTRFTGSFTSGAVYLRGALLSGNALFW